MEDIVEFPITDTLDLHTFRPKDIPSLIPEYLNECLIRNIKQVKIVHGKGTGKLRKGVHDLLKKNSIVKGLKEASPNEGGWGATIVFLH